MQNTLIKVYAYFIDKTTFGISTEKKELTRKKEEVGENKISYLEKVSLERAINWINFNRNKN